MKLINLSNIDFGDFDDELMNKLSDNKPHNDDVPDVKDIPKAKLGDIYQLGKNRIIAETAPFKMILNCL